MPCQKCASHSDMQLQVPYYLWRAINGRAADVKRCHLLRDCFRAFDLTCEDSLDLRTHMLQAAMSPTILRCPEGRRLLAAFFDLDPQLSIDLIAVIKNHIVIGLATILDAYGAPLD
jgi:Condensin II non structural maintenance of chromosomes subunit